MALTRNVIGQFTSWCLFQELVAVNVFQLLLRCAESSGDSLDHAKPIHSLAVQDGTTIGAPA